MLAADPDRFAAAIAEIDRKLQERAELLQRTRERLARLPACDWQFVSAEVAGFLDRLRELGVSERTVQAPCRHRADGARRLDRREARRRVRLVPGQPAPLCAG